MSLCFIGLGSNLRSPVRQLNQALQKLHKIPRTSITAHSKLYFSKPCGIRSQPPFYNMVISLFTTLTPQLLLFYCQQIEHKHHRLRAKKGGARTLDLDLLLYGNREIHGANLTLPHSELLKRDFVWVPLLEIAPTALMPDGTPLRHHIRDGETYLFHGFGRS
ncbi:MAG: 2-amino-4-hydroxy-6-hydroxymethyldihydropteridine diphosphokinase [Legionellales bacterium]|nr:2-amino-4-hydroxy-6-hydroxymethyldihydropteridine diphosphokinase [Legionellales bacterium]